jgi:nucleoside 2-deoxyribosyltransferase
VTKREDPFDSPEWREYAAHVREVLIPMIEDSAVTMSLVSPNLKTDVKFAVELGFMIMLDKPIIAVIPPGTEVPLKLAKVADEIVEGEITDPDFQFRMAAAIDRVMKRLGKKGKRR